MTQEIITEPDSQGYRWKMDNGELRYFDPLDKRWYPHYWGTLYDRLKYCAGRKLYADVCKLAVLLPNWPEAYRTT